MPISQLKVVRFRKKKSRKTPLFLVIAIVAVLSIILLNIFVGGSENKDPFAGLNKNYQYETCPVNINFTYEPLKITEKKVIAAVKKGRKWEYCEIDVMSQLSEEELSSSSLSP